MRMGLIDDDEQPVMTHLTGGVSSLIMRVDTRRGPLCVKQALPELKVASQWSAPLERSHAELAWIRHVSQCLPESVPAILGEDPSSVFWCNGQRAYGLCRCAKRVDQRNSQQQARARAWRYQS